MQFFPLFAVSCFEAVICAYSVKNNLCLLRNQGQTAEMGNMYKSDELKTFFRGKLENIRSRWISRTFRQESKVSYFVHK